jgi:hypothetical protein
VIRSSLTPIPKRRIDMLLEDAPLQAAPHLARSANNKFMDQERMKLSMATLSLMSFHIEFICWNPHNSLKFGNPRFSLMGFMTDSANKWHGESS